MAPEKNKNQACIWIAAGCGGALLILTVILVLGGVFAVKKTKEFGEAMKDPVRREQRTLEVLGAETLPVGYNAAMAMSIPYLVDMAVLSSKQPNAEGDLDDLGERSFIYLKVLSLGADQDELRDFFAGKTDDAKVLRDNNINMDLEEVIRRGSLQAGPQEVLYVANRGEVRTGKSRNDGLVTLVWIPCNNDKRMRMGIWMTPDPSPDAELAEADFTGSGADENAITAFVGHFDLCR